jgi:hypothetical protein
MYLAARLPRVSAIAWPVHSAEHTTPTAKTFSRRPDSRKTTAERTLKAMSPTVGHSPNAVSGARTQPQADPLAATFSDELIAELSSRIDRLVLSVAAAGHDAYTLGTPADLADHMVASIPRSDPLNLEIGPFYTTASLTRWMGVSRQYVLELVKQRRILSLTTADKHKVYPSRQFGIRGAPMLHMADILAILDPYIDPWTEAMWLMTPSEALGDRTPIEHLAQNRGHEAVLLAAHQSIQIFGGRP